VTAPDAPWVLAIDVGGTWLRVARVTALGRVLDRRRQPTPAGGDAAAVVEAVGRLAAQLGGPARLAGVAAPGPVDPASGTVYSPPNLPGWGAYPLRSRLADRLGCPVWVHNDANLAALGEARFGAGRGADPLVYLTVSTGIGGGVILGGRIFEGAHGLAGELGHVIVRAGGPRCNAGHAGCLEALASGTAVQRRAAELAGTAGEPAAAEVAQAAAAGTAWAIQVLEEAGEALGLAIGGLINAFDPAWVVLGGGLTGAWELWAPAMQRSAEAVAMARAQRPVDIRRAALGDDGGLIGAAAHALDRAAR
jgi:glucokinase